jgi:hypothetical protein
VSLSGDALVDLTPEPGDSGDDQVPASLYRHHLYAARHLADLACELEKEHAGSADAEITRKHRAYVIGSVLAAAAFLEASINELYLEVQDHIANGNPENQRRVLAVLVADAEPFDEARSPFRDADGLVALRDALVHGRQEWRDSHGRRQNLERRIRGKFPHNALAREDDPEFPDRLLGAGCAMWAVRIAEKFSNDFCQRMAIPARGVSPRERAR